MSRTAIKLTFVSAFMLPITEDQPQSKTQKHFTDAVLAAVANAVAIAQPQGGSYTATGRCVLAGVLSASPPASASIFLKSRRNAMPVAVLCAKTLRLSMGSVFRPTRSNSERRSRARVMAGLDTLSLAANPRTVCASLAYERLAKDEALEAAWRAAGQTRAAPQTLRTVQDELLDERLARQNAEQEGEEEPQPV
jgi:hypothetical protein